MAVNGELLAKNTIAKINRVKEVFPRRRNSYPGGGFKDNAKHLHESVIHGR